jgi:thioredoxin 1
VPEESTRCVGASPVRLSLGTVTAYLATVAIDFGLGLVAGSALVALIAIAPTRPESSRGWIVSKDGRPSIRTYGGEPMSNVITLSEGNFESEVLDSELPILVDYWAPWCGPCRVVGPVVEEIAEEQAGRIKVGKLNVDAEPRLAREARILSIPYLVLYRDGEAAASLAGAYPKPVLEEILGLDGARPAAASLP